MILIRNAKILPMVGEEIPCGDILLKDGRIEAVGTNIEAPEDCRVVDAQGLWALPGFVDAHCHVGMIEDGIGVEGDDVNEMTDPVTPQLRAIDGINPQDFALEEACRHGVTCACTGPGSANVIGGQFAAIKTHGNGVDDMVVKAPLALKVAFGENPKRVYQEQKKKPTTRMTTAAILRETLVAAEEYRKKLDSDHVPDRDLKMEILVDVLEGDIPLKVHCHRADDIMTALRIASEFSLDLTLDHCTEGHLIVDQLKKANAKVILGPLMLGRPKIELKNLSFKAPAVFAAAGMKFALATDSPEIPLMYLPVCAALAVREGLDPVEALKCITIYPAEITGIQDRVGSLEVGKDGDVVLLDGDPLDVRSHVKMTFVNGEVAYQA